MATTTNYSWTTPDDTALVKDGASAIRSLGSAIDTTTKNLNPSTTLGDIEYRSSTANTNTRLAIGSTGHVLTVAGGVPSWAAPAASGQANWSLLNAGGTTLTGATTITVSGISGKDKILVLVADASTGAASDFISVRLNGDTATNYKYITAEYQWASTYAAANYAGSNATGGNDAINLARMSGSAGSAVNGYVLLTGANSSGVKVFQGLGNANADGSNGHRSYFPNGFYDSATTISSVSVRSSGSNFDGGTVFVYTSA
jgi:hypothetical protein